MYYIKAVCDSQVHMEQYRSGHNGHDWKSCVPQKGTEGSNPSCSAKKGRTSVPFLFYIFYSTVFEGNVHMKEYKNYLFDLYGTLVDIHTNEENDLLWKRMSIILGMQGVRYTGEELRKQYMQEVSQRETAARKERGAGAEIDIGPVFESFFAAQGVAANTEIVAQLAREFRVLSLEKLRLFPGVLEMLQRLKRQGKGVYLVSNAQALFTLPEMKALDLPQYFDGIVISSVEGFKKPDSRIYSLTLQRYELDPKETVMIGNDDQADCWGACRAGLDSMYVYTEQSPIRTSPLPKNCRILENISQVF